MMRCSESALLKRRPHLPSMQFTSEESERPNDELLVGAHYDPRAPLRVRLWLDRSGVRLGSTSRGFKGCALGLRIDFKSRLGLLTIMAARG